MGDDGPLRRPNEVHYLGKKKILGRSAPEALYHSKEEGNRNGEGGSLGPKACRPTEKSARKTSKA